MEAAHGLYHRVPGAQMEMIGVAQLHLGADLLQIRRTKGPFNGPLGTHVHKYRGLHRAVGAGKLPPPGQALGL